MKILAAIFICLSLTATSIAKIITVDANGTGDYPTIQDAIDDSNDGDTIMLLPGTYTGDGNRDIDYAGKAITVRSTDPNNPNIVAQTIIDCNATDSDRHRGFYFHNNEDPNSILAGLVITRGSGWIKGGGGILCDNSSPVIRDCIIRNNFANHVFVTGGGGGISLAAGARPIISRCTIAHNKAQMGGGIWSFRSHPIISHCLIIDNEAHWGGGIGCLQSKATILRCVIAQCYSDMGGGGVYCVGEDSPRIVGCTIAHNHSNGYGGGIYCSVSNTVIQNCIVWANSVLSRGPQISLTTAPCLLAVSYCDIEGGSTHVYAEENCLLDWGAGNIVLDPLFNDSNELDYHLKSQAGRWNPNTQSFVEDDITSPCIDAGDPMAPIGPEPFPNGGIINMGAYGGTTEASKSYFDKPPCEIIVAGDINGDCEINFKDFFFIGLHWLGNP